MFQKFYIYKDNIYCTIEVPHKMKCTKTGEWVEAVTYFRLDNDRFKNGKGIYVEIGLPNFCREKGDFDAKFKEVEFKEESISG